MLARSLTLLALAAAGFVPAAQSAAPAGPTGLRAFLLRADEPAVDSFPRTPSFAWSPFDGARSYDFELWPVHLIDADNAVEMDELRAMPLLRPARGYELRIIAHGGNGHAHAQLAVRGRDVVRRLVRRRGQGDLDDDQRRRRAGVLHLPPGPGLVGDRAVARPSRAQAVRRLAQRTTRRVGGALEPDLRLRQPAGVDRSDLTARPRLWNRRTCGDFRGNGILCLWCRSEFENAGPG